MQIDYKFASHVNPSAAVRIGLDTLAIFYRHYILNTYRQAGHHVEREGSTRGARFPSRGGVCGRSGSLNTTDAAESFGFCS